MHKFGALLINEWIKMYKKKSFFIAYAIMVAFVALFAYVIDKLSPAGAASEDFTAGLMSMSAVGQLLPFIVIIFTAGIVSQEHRFGTIKFLLIRAQSRSKILASKYVVMLLFSFSLLAVTLLASLVAEVILYGMDSLGEASWGSIWTNILYVAVYTIVYSTLTFMAGVLTKSSGATVGIGMLTIMGGGILTMLLSSYSFSKFILFPNADLSVYILGEPPVEGMTMGFSVIVLVVYVAAFLTASFVTFKKRDVA